VTGDPKLQLVATLTGARTYHFRSNDHYGWALCTVNDATGELLITSDWGNWAHRWNPAHLGRPSLTHFIADRNDCDYLANKLLDRDDVWVLDADETIAKWRRRVVSLRRDRRLSGHEARQMWDDLGSLHEDAFHEAYFIEHAGQIEGFSQWICERPWDETEHRYSHTYRLLVDFLLPALSRACSETVRAAA
jgi:hypothetical protein